MKNKALAILSLFLLTAGMAEAGETDSDAQFLLARETSVSTAFRAQLGLGLLDSPRGTPITNYFGIDYALTPDFGIGIGLPLAGTLSNGPDDYGIGNVVLGAKYVAPLDRLRFAVGLDAATPTARTSAALGLFTRQVTWYAKDQFALSPYVAVSYVRDRITLSADFGTDLQIFTKSAAGRDKIEDILFYDAAVAMSIDPNLWGTVEMGGYSTLTYGGNNQTELFAGPGFRFQDQEISLGVHFLAPFRKPARDVIDFMVVGDFRVYF
jgi:hypothetical protein